MTTTPRTSGSIKMGRQGRIVIPADLREQLGFEEGTRLSARIVDGELRVMTYGQNLRRIQDRVRRHLDAGGRTSAEVMEEFFAERRRDAALDNAE
jgi:AbrB family looped-hinge helix DNA binding protein